MRLGIYIISLLFILNSCKEEGIKKHNIDKSKKSESDIRKCINHSDTAFGSNNSIKYIVIDSFYTLKIKLNRADTVLDFQFNCSVPYGLVPVLHSYSEHTICLVIGTGQHYREFFILSDYNDSLIINRFETALTTDLKNNKVVYFSNESLIVEDIKLKSKEEYKIEPIPISKNIQKTNLQSDNVQIIFTDSTKLLVKRLQRHTDK